MSASPRWRRIERILRTTEGLYALYTRPMGAILAVMGEPGDPELARAMERMTGRSPHRGEARLEQVRCGVIAVQSLGWDASLAANERHLLALHGFIGNWDEVAPAHGLRFDGNQSAAARALQSFELLGDGLFDLLRGEFAVLIYDQREHTLRAVRDHMGCRSLYWEAKGRRAFFATEIRQVLAGSGSEPDLDRSALLRILTWQFHPSTTTIHQGVERTPPGGVLKIRAPWSHSAAHSWEFWRLPQEPVDPLPRGVDPVEVIEQALIKAVRRRVPERPTAVALSGGLDSRAIWGVLHSRPAERWPKPRLEAITLVYPGMECDEEDDVRALHEALGTTGIYVDNSSYRPSAYVSEVAQYLDEPCHPMTPQQLVVASQARAAECDCLITGVGLDDFRMARWGALYDALLGMRLARFGSGVCLALRAHRSPKVIVRNLLSAGGWGFPRRPQWLREEVWRPHREVFMQLWQRRRNLSRTSRVALYGLDALQYGPLLGALEQLCSRCRIELRNPLVDPDLYRSCFAVAAGHGLVHRAVEDAVARLAPPREHERKILFNELMLADSRERREWKRDGREFLQQLGLVRDMDVSRVSSIAWYSARWNGLCVALSRRASGSESHRRAASAFGGEKPSSVGRGEA
jgi:hypothetical protein